MKRRRFILASIATAVGALPGRLNAQNSAKTKTIGFLYPGVAAAAEQRVKWLVEGLREAGFAVGNDFEVVRGIADGDPKRISRLAQELVAHNVDVIVAVSPSAVRAARGATSTVSIIAIDLETDPVASGFVASVSRPGGNLTGLFLDTATFSTKWVELLKEAVPHLDRVAIFWDPATGSVQLNATLVAMTSVRLERFVIEVRSPAELEQSFGAAVEWRANGLVALSSPVFGANPKAVADLALRHGLPSIMLFSEFAQTGGLLSYGPSLIGLFHQTGAIIGKTLRGIMPAEQPVERPARFDLIVNLKTARTLGLTIPQSILVRADEVIQ